MRSVITVVIIFTISMTAAAQRGLRLKVVQNTDNIERTVSRSDLTYTVSNERIWNFSRISFALEFEGRKNWTHQLELFFPQVMRPTVIPGYPLNYSYWEGHHTHESSAFALRYEVLKKFG